MTGPASHILQIEPKEELIFNGPFTEIVTSVIRLTSYSDKPVAFKVKTTVPKSYCVRPSNAFIEPHESVEVTVMLQPFAYQASEKSTHKFMIQSVVVLDDPRPSLEQLWKETPSDQFMEVRLTSIFRMPGDLLIEPARDIIFTGPYDRTVHSTIKLSNPLSDYVSYRINASKRNFTTEPRSGILNPHAEATITVLFESQDYDGNSKSRERITIQSITSTDDTDPALDELYTDSRSREYSLRCVLKDFAFDDKSEATKRVHYSNSKPVSDTESPKNIEKLLAKIEALRQENAALKGSDIHSRMSAISNTCNPPPYSDDSSITSNPFANIPPILYLVLALLVGLFLGRFVL